MVVKAPPVDETHAISELTLNSVEPIPFELFGKKGNKTTHLVNNTNPEQELSGKNLWYNFPLEEPVFVDEIEVIAEGYNYKSCEFQWQSMSHSEPRTRRVKFEDGSFKTKVQDIIIGFNFRPDQKYMSGTTISKVVATGFTIAELEEAKHQLSNLEATRSRAVREAKKTISDAETARTKIVEHELEIEALKVTSKELSVEQSSREKAVKTLSDQLEGAKKALASIKAQQSASEARIEQQASIIEERTLERTQINKEIVEKSAELKDLEGSLYMFPSELKQFSLQGSKDKAFYWKLSVIPIAVLTAITYVLLTNAANLTTIVDENENARLLSIFITRIPFVVVTGALVGVMFKLAHSLISQIMRIDSQTRALAKISIIATDVSAAASDKLELDDEQIYHLRTGLKMDLLREHLKSYISEDYNYLGSERVSSRIERIKDRFEAKQEAEKEALEEINDELEDNLSAEASATGKA